MAANLSGGGGHSLISNTNCQSGLRCNMDFVILQLVVAAFISLVTFVIFIGTSSAGIKTIATTLVRSRLDCCNSLYHNIALEDILKLQPMKFFWARVAYLVSSFFSLSTTS